MAGLAIIGVVAILGMGKVERNILGHITEGGGKMKKAVFWPKERGRTCEVCGEPHKETNGCDAEFTIRICEGCAGAALRVGLRRIKAAIVQVLKEAIDAS